MKTYPTRLPGAALLSLAPCVAQSGSTARGEVFSDEAALAQSQIYAQNGWFDCVGVYGVQQGGTWHGYGSSVLIADGSWALITGHQAANQTYTANAFVLKNADGSLRSLTTIDAVYVNPGYAPGFYDSGDDITLLHLTSRVTEVTPAVLYGSDYVRGMGYSMAGFGQAGIAGQATMAYDGIKRAGNNMGNSFGGDIRLPGQGPQYIGADFDSPGSGGASALEWLGSNFDSGSGWFTQVNSQWQLAVLSTGGYINGVNKYGSTTLGVRIGNYTDWISSYVSVPEPSTGSLGLLGGVLFLLRRRSGATSVASTPSPPLERP
jgi:hypothetical protein